MQYENGCNAHALLEKGGSLKTPWNLAKTERLYEIISAMPYKQ